MRKTKNLLHVWRSVIWAEVTSWECGNFTLQTREDFYAMAAGILATPEALLCLSNY